MSQTHVHTLSGFLSAHAFVGSLVHAAQPPDQEPQRDDGSRKPDGSDRGNPFRGVGTAYVLLGATLVGVGLGLAIDRWLASEPKGLIICSLIFIGAGLYQVVKESQR